jgi:hypothetical protein
MMKKIAVVLGVVFSLSLVGFGQNRTVTARRNVTNSDLETFRQKRLDAERDYRENYERMGFPSPEELAKQRDDDMADRLQLADQLRQSRLEKERIELERDKVALDSARLDAERQAVYDTADYPDGSFWGGYGGFGGFGGFGSGGSFGGFFPRHHVIRAFPRNRLLPARGFQTFRITPAGVFPAGTMQSPGFGFPVFGPRGGGVIGFPGRHR